MTLLQLIAHLKEVMEQEGNLEVRIGLQYATKNWPPKDIKVDPESKTITFT